MYRFCGLPAQQYGDLVMNTFAARVLKQKYPNSEYTILIANDYKDCAPLFLNHPHIDKIHILDKKRDGLNEIDQNWVKNQSFDMFFPPMKDHNHSDPWFLKRHQVSEVCYMHGIVSDKECNKLDNKLFLNKWFDLNTSFSDYIAFSPFSGFYNPNNDKISTIEKAQKIVDNLIDKGLKVLQIGAFNEPKLFGSIQLECDYFTSIKNMLSCKFLICGDSGCCWYSSAYDFPTLGLYSNKYYTKDYLKNIQPINKNAIYLDSDNVNNIEDQDIFAAIDKMIEKTKN